MRWLVCDYGEVISDPPLERDVAALAACCGVGEAAFLEAYWARRVDYDRGDLDAASFWKGVVEPLDDERLEQLVELDVASWTRLNPAAQAAVDEALAHGFRLALLSNAPVEIARRLDAHAWFDRFEHRLFSCDLGCTKPDPAIFTMLLERLAARGDEVVFVDDRLDNVEAARTAGLRAVHYRQPQDLRLW